MAARPSLTVSLLGGASSIGASCALVQVGETRLLVDCGIRFAAKNPLPDLAQLAGKRLDAVLVTHAHTDHSGALPVLAEAFPATPVYATAPSIDLTTILLRDALKLMHGSERDGELPLYAQAQVDRLADALVPVHHGQSVRVGEIEITFLPAAHILGAAMVYLETPAGNVLMTGDYSVSAQLTVPALSRPSLAVDMVVTEATYGERLHEDRDVAERRLVGQIRSVTESGGRVLIPAFAIGRAQEILMVLKRALRNGSLPELPVFVDGMVRSVCGVYGQHERYVTRALAHDIRHAEHPFYTNGIRPVADRGERQAALDAAPCVIVASSGMLAGGASVHYAQALAASERDAILITGYQDEESPGRALLRLAETDEPRELELGGRVVPVRCRFDTYGLSAHADRLQMVALLEALRPRTVVLVHGDAGAKRALGGALSCPDVVLAEDGDVISRSFPLWRCRREARAALTERDVDAVRALLGPAGEAPLAARKVAQAWYGDRVEAGAVERFAAELERLGLARRDDHRRGMLWVLGPGESDRFPDEAALEAELKLDNPKGRLLELCMRLRIEPPESTFDVQGAFHVVSSTLALPAGFVQSGPQRASSKKAAEQLAARALLARIAASEQQLAAQPIDEQLARRLRADNPKGRLLELCAARKLSPPRFEQRAVADGFHLRAVSDLSLPGQGPLGTRWYAAAAIKVGEQAAADEMLSLLDGASLAGDLVQHRSPEPAAGAAEREANGGPPPGNPQGLLNELRQLGVIDDFGYELRERRGPSHQPVFVMSGWASSAAQGRIETEPLEGASKKGAQRDVAARLVELLAERGLTGRPDWG